MTRPLFVISLDFELYWGVRDVVPLARAKDVLLGERVAVEALLVLFARRSIRATWATVGALFCRTKREFLDLMPTKLPTYRDSTLSPYASLDQIGTDEADDPFHFAPSLIAKIAATPGQELGTHTFSHYYCLESGQTAEAFGEDLAAARRVGGEYGEVTQSLVFPRNQYNPAYLDVLGRHGVKAYRSNGAHWAYRAQTSTEPLHRRAFRLGDTYLPLSGHRGHVVSGEPAGPLDVPASAFLRPYSTALRRLEGLRHARIAGAMRRCARLGGCYHLWWHPSNFSTHLRENLSFLESVLDEFDVLRERFGMESVTMAEAAMHSLPGVRRPLAD